jgi:hypothetical protein
VIESSGRAVTNESRYIADGDVPISIEAQRTRNAG